MKAEFENCQTNRNSIRANGEKIRELRLLVGLTQLELAVRIDCSERLIRKMEKGKVVDAKSLALVQAFFSLQGIAVELTELFILVPIKHFAQLWFEERFINRTSEVDSQWLNPNLLSDPQQASQLLRLEELDITAVLQFACTANDVGIRFEVLTHMLDQRNTKTLWLTIEGQKIVGLKF
jgi:transcriptional regulator with XRE-family HTH domain